MPSTDQTTRQRLDALEHEARHHPGKHKLRLIGVVLVGYLYPALLAFGVFALVVVLFAIAPAIWGASPDPVFIIIYIAAVIGALVLATIVLRTLWVKLPEPFGHPLGDNDAPRLRQILTEVQRATHAPKVHKILLDTSFNAGVAQLPRFGFWGPRTNYLILGFPLLIGLNIDQFRAILAHEFAHLRGGHNAFTAWIYRVQQTWHTIGQSLAGAQKLRWLVIGWFANWYGQYLATTTLALRRIHEYEADRRAADAVGAPAIADLLLAIAWIGYRMEKSFWPALFRRTATEPLPPADILALVSDFLATDALPDQFERFRARELRSRTPITSDHPCLTERIAATGDPDLLQSRAQALATPPASDSALSLLDDSQQRLCKIANASFKALAIQRWRYEHAISKAILEKLEKPDAAADTDDIEWQKCQATADTASPDGALAVLRDFLTRFPSHAYANFELARMLLVQDDDAPATAHFETSMKHGSDCITPALTMLLDYYRDAGRDTEADVIRQRLVDHEQNLARAGKERLTVSKRDRFAPHDLKPAELACVTRILFRYSRITAAHLVRKELSLFTDKPSYVLAIRRRTYWFEERNDKLLIESLRNELPISCAIVILRRFPSRLQKRILATCPTPIFLAAD